MKKKIIPIIIIIISIIVIIVIKKIAYSKSDFVLDNENKYIITTNTKKFTMRKDGGSHTNIYYQVDLKENKVIKCEDVIEKKFLGWSRSIGNILYSKVLNETEESKLKSILDLIIKRGEEKKDYDSSISSSLKLNEIKNEIEIELYSYTLTSFNNEDIKIYDKDIINSIEELLKI